MLKISTKQLFELLTKELQQPFVVRSKGQGCELICASAAIVDVATLSPTAVGTKEAICISTLAQHGCPDGEWFFIGPFTIEPVTNRIIFECDEAMFVGDLNPGDATPTATKPLVETSAVEHREEHLAPVGRY